MSREVALRRQDLSILDPTDVALRQYREFFCDRRCRKPEVREKARDLWVVLPQEVVETVPGCSNHVLEQLSKFAKSINYKIGSFAQQLRSVKTCGETHGKALRMSSCKDTNLTVCPLSIAYSKLTEV